MVKTEDLLNAGRDKQLLRRCPGRLFKLIPADLIHGGPSPVSTCIIYSSTVWCMDLAAAAPVR